MSRSVQVMFKCDGPRCEAEVTQFVQVTLNENHEMVMVDSLPAGWSEYLEDERYDHVSEARRRNTTACPKCKIDLRR